VTLLSDIRDYPWTSLLAGLLPAKLAGLLPARFQTRAAQIVPSASIAGHALIVVIAIMSFLACLTLGAVYMVNQSANAWVNDISSEITIELDPVNTADIEKKMTLVSLFLAKQKGVTRVRPLTAEDSAKLLEPWLGTSNALQALPIPRLIAVEIDRSNPPDIQVIKTALTQNFEGVTLDDHRRWQAEIKTLTRSAALAGLAVLSLVAVATIAVIVSATRSAMASNR
jgi:cell division transport system permease protein